MTDPRCPQCGSPLADGRLADQCPRCLGALAFGPDALSGDGGASRAQDYEFIRELGRGGIGVVYEARQRSLQRRVAVKMLLTGPWSQPGAQPRFRAEAEAAARLRHPGIVTIHEIGEREGQPFLAMELLAGPSLADLVRSQPIGPRRAARYVRLVAEAIAHAHRQGVLHRDLKPSNVLLDDTDHPRVTDFGLAKFLDARAGLTRTGELIGSPNYLPPEQVGGHAASVSGDVYALGAILYELLTTRPPFVAESVAATLQQVLHAEPVRPRQLNPEVPLDLETVCLQCLHKEPARRYSDAAELAADLARFEAGEPVQARPMSHPERLLRWCRRSPALAAVSIALAAAVVFGFGGVLAQWRRAESSRATMAEHLYAADIAAAGMALKEGNLGRAREMLRRHALAPGTAAASELAGRTDDRPDLGSGNRTEFTGRLLRTRCRGDELAVLATHTWIVTTVAVSPDGRWIASGSQAQPDTPASTLQLTPFPGHPSNPTPPPRLLPLSNTVWSVAFTGDSRTLFSGGAEGVRAWDVATGLASPDFPAFPGHEIAVAGSVLVASPNHPFFEPPDFEPLRVLDLETGRLRSLPVRGRHPALSPDGRRVAVLDAGRNLRIHDLTEGRLLATVATNHLVFHLRFSPDGTRLAAAGQMTAAKVWDPATPGAPPLAFRSPHNVWDAAFTPDGATLVTATSHQQLEIWDLATAARRGSRTGHDNEVWSVAVAPDGRHLVSGSKDRTVRLWTLAASPAPTAVPQWRHARPAFSPDGTHLLTGVRTNGRDTATIWQLPAAGRPVATQPRAVGTFGGHPLGFAPGGVHVLELRDDRPALDWRRMPDGTRERTVELAGAPGRLNRAVLALAGDARSFAGVDQAGVWGRWSTEDGRRLNRWESPEGSAPFRRSAADGRRPETPFRALAASHGGRWLAVGPLGTSQALLIDFEGSSALRLRGHRDDIAALAFAPGDGLLATGSVDGTIRLWNVADGRPLAELPGHLESVEAVAFSPDGLTLASINPGIEVAFWHLPTGRELARLPHPEAGYHLVFSPDGRRLALNVTAGNLETDTDRVELWEAP